MKFSQELAAGSPFAARQFIAGKDAVTLATDILALDQEAFSAAFRKSPMKRAKLAVLRRNAAAVLGNSRFDDDRPLLQAMLQHDKRRMREHRLADVTRARSAHPKGRLFSVRCRRS